MGKKLKYERFDKRKYARINTALDTRFVIISQGTDRDIFSRTMQAKTKSISISGVSLVTNTVQVEGLHICSSISGMAKNKLKLEIDLPSNYKTITPIGEVCWYDLIPESEEYLYNVGVSFIELSEEDSEVLNRFTTTERKKTKTSLSFLRKWFLRE
ncbi:MAG: hypothetical protein FD151_352 [bacterium]|nr:MAG: hypothetical protein FD151_352 [bacterium]